MKFLSTGKAGYLTALAKEEKRFSLRKKVNVFKYHTLIHYVNYMLNLQTEISMFLPVVYYRLEHGGKEKLSFMCNDWAK